MDTSAIDQEFRELAIKCLDKTATEEERKKFDQIYGQLLKRHAVWDSKLMGEETNTENLIFQSLIDNVRKYKNRKRTFNLYRYISAAILLLAISAGIYFIRFREQAVVKADQSVVIHAGSNKAVLTLANGHKIILDQSNKGEIARQSGIRISTTDHGELVYDISSGPETNTGNTSGLNTIETPSGGEYQVILSDGSHVWLNALSSLKYPATFPNKGGRKVELKGEGYFQVAKNKSNPFQVYTGRQTVEVLGTHFNIKAYKDEADIRTTLIEGSVKVSAGQQSVQIVPGQQAVLDARHALNVRSADTGSAIAWVNGDFVFNSEDMGSIMRSISRWYAVEVIFKDNLTDKKFTGTISRYKNVTEVLNMLELTGLVHFKLEGRRILVMK
ncbi:hypothetical protein DBR11_08595 [Pedobacter sp. HMWF019]|uniref:FecR family protein n=1 Tax=Pedobacter sp. HMWF019 TaxID=2056856 RepID=UPI000D3CF58A|nr:FecR family protein [Pedobacter sp. HMWF019]PTT00936.1 hypothetical protein DBR11_08595 [Pedobacter sp. HMWF019]